MAMAWPDAFRIADHLEAALVTSRQIRNELRLAPGHASLRGAPRSRGIREQISIVEHSNLESQEFLISSYLIII